MQDAPEILRRIYDDWSDGDFRAGQETLSDSVVFVGDDPTRGQVTCHGPGEIRRYMHEFLTSWRQVRHVAEEFIEHGERVLVVARQIGVGKHSGTKTEHPTFAVWTFRGDEVIRLEHYRDRGSAVAAAGLQD